MYARHEYARKKIEIFHFLTLRRLVSYPRMPLLRACFRQVTPIARSSIRIPAVLGAQSIRFNSTKPVSLTADIFPVEKDSITEENVDEWLHAVQSLKSGKLNIETEAEVYLNQLTKPEQFLEEKFEPTEEQLMELEQFKNSEIPLKSDPIVDNLTNLIMRHGKKTKAQKIVTRALYIVYLKTRKDPLEILYETLDKLGPVVTTMVEKTGFAKNRIVPIPLNKRQRNRYAITWILQGAKNKKSPDMAVRLAEEIISAYEGKSSGYDKMSQMHKTAMQQRAYIKL